MKIIGIMTFHHSYNCGSMMQAFALQKTIQKLGYDSEIINFSNKGQQKLYQVWFPMTTIKNIVKNFLIYPYRKKIKKNNLSYEYFMNMNMILSSKYSLDMKQLCEDEYYAVIAGSDQIWNITIDDADDAYFLNWVKKAKKIAYAPSFGARNLMEYAKDVKIYKKYLEDFSALSIRENNGQKWIFDLTQIEAPVVLDPTLLLDAEEYEKLIKGSLKLPKKYIFYYAPHYEKKINELVFSVSKKLKLPVIAFNAKSFYVKRMNKYGFKIPEVENPAVYLELIKNAELVMTTSFHGTIFSSVFKKKFWVIKNGGMFSSDDRVLTMTDILNLSDRIIPIQYDETFDYAKPKDYSDYEILLQKERKKSIEYLSKALIGVSND